MRNVDFEHMAVSLEAVMEHRRHGHAELIVLAGGNEPYYTSFSRDVFDFIFPCRGKKALDQAYREAKDGISFTDLQKLVDDKEATNARH